MDRRGVYYRGRVIRHISMALRTKRWRSSFPDRQVGGSENCGGRHGLVCICDGGKTSGIANDRLVEIGFYAII